MIYVLQFRKKYNSVYDCIVFLILIFKFLFLQPTDGLRMVQCLSGCPVDVGEGNWRYCSGTKPSLRSLSFLAFNQEVSV